MKVAIVHDWLTNMGGAEKVIIQLHKMFPNAPIYTSVVNYDKLDPIFQSMDIRTTFIQRMPMSKEKYNRYLPLFPIAFESLDLTSFDLILSSSSSVGVKGVLRDSNSMHICYCHTPPRYAWDFYQEYLYSSGKIQRALIRPLMHYLRIYDQLSANRVDHFIANSSIVAKRINKIYRRDAEVIHPPVDTLAFAPDQLVEEDFYLVVSRLVPYKRIDLAIKACNQLKRRLIIIGDGEEMPKLQKLAGPTIQFLGYNSDSVLKDYMARCRAFIFPGYEDFGITPVEAQAAGKPVIAYGKGGVLDSVINNKTGVFFAEQSIDSLISGIKRFEASQFDSKKIIEHAKQFDNEVFRAKMMEFINKYLG